MALGLLTSSTNSKNCIKLTFTLDLLFFPLVQVYTFNLETLYFYPKYDYKIPYFNIFTFVITRNLTYSAHYSLPIFAAV